MGLTQNTTYYYRVRAYNSGGYSAYSNEVSVKFIAFSNVSASSHGLNTAASETATISYTIDTTATVTLKIIPENLGASGTPIYQLSQSCTAATTCSFTWNGKDSNGNVVSDGAYLYILEALASPAAGWYMPSAPTSGSLTCSQGCSQNASYNPFHNEPLNIAYTLSQPAKVNMSIVYPNTQWPSFTVPVMSTKPHSAGTHTFAWDGRKSDGSIAPPGGAASLSVSSSSWLGENIIITSGNTPIISGVTAEPYAMSVSYNEITKIQYLLSQDAVVTVKLIVPSGASTTLINAQVQTAGEQIITWNGLDSADATGKKSAVSEEGFYTVEITATNPATGTSSKARASLKVHY